MAQLKDFSNGEDIKWCPGCGDHGILKHLQASMAKSGSEPHKTVVVSGIGCSSRLPYYMKTYGFHTIHGRSLPIATGLKLSRPDMEVWVVTGDGDSLSIGTNHFVHLFKRDIDINILLFNNNIYGLTKGQYSPTSAHGLNTKSSPSGNVEFPLNPLQLALASKATFLSRSLDKDAAHLQSVMLRAKEHKGASLVEILQNCPIFNDGVFDKYTSRQTQSQFTVKLEEGKPLIFGNENEYSIVLEDLVPKVILTSEINNQNVWIHDEKNSFKAYYLTQFGYDAFSEFPLALGVLYSIEDEARHMIHANVDYENTLQQILYNGKYLI